MVIFTGVKAETALSWLLIPSGAYVRASSFTLHAFQRCFGCKIWARSHLYSWSSSFYSLTHGNIVYLKTPIIAEIVEKLFAQCETRNLITVFTKPHLESYEPASNAEIKTTWNFTSTPCASSWRSD
jgi:hypothetical protein